jgi:hypothetical protein
MTATTMATAPTVKLKAMLVVHEVLPLSRVSGFGVEAADFMS